MTTIHYRRNTRTAQRNQKTLGDRATLWMLIIVMVGAALALSFGDAHGFTGFLN